MKTTAFRCIHFRESITKPISENNLAASVIGFTNRTVRSLRLESQYDEYLSGTDEKVISARMQGNECPIVTPRPIDAQDGTPCI